MHAALCPNPLPRALLWTGWPTASLDHKPTWPHVQFKPYNPPPFDRSQCKHDHGHSQPSRLTPSLASTSAPERSSSRAASKYPFWAATCRGVLPDCRYT